MDTQRPIDITAVSVDEALRIAAKKLGAPVDQLITIDTASAGSSLVRVTIGLAGNSAAERLEALLDQVARELDDIELAEITEGLTEEELNERAMLGKGAPRVDYGKYSRARRAGNVVFADNVAFYEAADDESPEHIPRETLRMQTHVKRGDIFARLELENRARAPAFPARYSETAHVEIRHQENTLQFVAATNGMAVIWKGLPYLAPADRDASCDIAVSGDRMCASATITPALGEGACVDQSAIRAKLKQAGVTYGIDEQSICQIVREAAANEPIQNQTVARGTPPVDGVDATFEILFQQAPTVGDFEVLPDGRVDYRRNIEIPAVKKDALLGRVHAPRAGRDGTDVLGNPALHKPGEEEALCPGENVRMQDNQLYAETDGYPSLNGSILSVYPTHVVESNVDYHTGNIEFNGNIIIKGDVLPGFEVKASGDITVMSNIDNAAVRAERDLIVYGGIVGDENIVVRCGRDLYCTYLQNATVEVEGDATVHRSAVQSSLSCSGKAYLTAGKGAFIGGSITAARGVEINVAGSASGVRTEIIAGHDFVVKKRLEEFERSRNGYAENIAKLDRLLMPLIEMVRKGAALAPAKKEAFAAALRKRKAMRKTERILKSRMRDLERKSVTAAAACVRVHRDLFPGAVVRIGPAVTRITESISRVELFFDAASGTIGRRPT